MKKIIIIGATSGIGLEVARCYLKDGWQVGVAGRREEELEKIRLSAPGQVCTQTIDVTREDAPFSLEQLITKMGGMDVFLLSSGIGKQNLSLCPDIELQTAATNVSGFIRMVNAAYHYFEQQGKGHIAVISSIAGTKIYTIRLFQRIKRICRIQFSISISISIFDTSIGSSFISQISTQDGSIYRKIHRYLCPLSFNTFQ